MTSEQMSVWTSNRQAREGLLSNVLAGVFWPFKGVSPEGSFVNLAMWLEVPAELLENEVFRAALERRAEERASELGMQVVLRQEVESTEKPYHKLVCWDLS